MNIITIILTSIFIILQAAQSVASTSFEDQRNQIRNQLNNTTNKINENIKRQQRQQNLNNLDNQINLNRNNGNIQEMKRLEQERNDIIIHQK